MTHEFPEYPGDEGKVQPDESAEIVLAETVLSVLTLGRELRTDGPPLAAAKQYQLAVKAENFWERTLTLPNTLNGVFDPEKLELAIITYNFASDADRPYVELRFETEDHVVANISKPGTDAEAPYNCSVRFGEEDYDVPLSTDEVADLFSQIVVPAVVEGESVSDPQFPPQSRNIIETLFESQNADIVESQFFEFTVPEDDEYQESKFKAEVHSINNESQEIQIELISEDDIKFDTTTGEPTHSYRSIVGTFMFDSDDFYQSANFTLMQSGEEPRDLKKDLELLKMFRQEIAHLYKFIHEEPDEILMRDIDLDI